MARKTIKRTREKKTFLLEVGVEYPPDGLRPVMAKYLEWLAVKGYSETTLTHLENGLILFARWCEDRGLKRPQEVTRAVLELFQRHLFYYRRPNGLPLTARTQGARLSALKGLFKWATRQNHVQANPASELDLPRPEKRLPALVLTPAEAERVLALPNVKTLLGLRDRAILETLYSTGIRRRELSELTVYSVHFGRKTVMVRKGKNKKDRLIPISDRALAWITRYLDEVRPELVVEPDPKHLFLSATGLPLVVEELTTMVGRYVRASGVSETGSCHVFRHTMATAMMENGADIRIIQEILGHELLETTKIYTHLSIEKLRQVYLATHPAAAAAAKTETGDEPAPAPVPPAAQQPAPEEKAPAPEPDDG